MTLRQALHLFVYADWAMALVALAALCAAIGWGLYATIPRNKGRRRQWLLRALMSFLVVGLYWGTQVSVLISVTTDHWYQWDPLRMVLFALPLAVMLAGLIASIVCGLWALARRTGMQRWQTVLRSLLGVVVFGVGAAPHTAAMLVMMVAEDHSNLPGTLTHVGEPVPDFELTDIEGTPFRTVDLRGKVIVLNFFATWCGPCQMELPHLQVIWDELRSNGEFRMLVVGREESDDSVKAFRQEHGFTFPMASDRDASIYKNFASKSIPRTYLVSRQGTIIYQWTGGYEEEIPKLRKLLNRELAKE